MTNFSFYRGQIFKISSVDNLVNPPLFTLVDLMNDPVKGSYYCEQLKQAQDPTSNDYWTIEKVLKKRKRNGQEEQLVKFLWYPGYCLRKKVAMNFFSTDFTYQFYNTFFFFLNINIINQ